MLGIFFALYSFIKKRFFQKGSEMKNLLIVITILLSANVSMGHQALMPSRNLVLAANSPSYLVFHDDVSRIVQIPGCSIKSIIKRHNNGFGGNSQDSYHCPKNINLKLTTKKYVDDHYYSNQRRIDGSVKTLRNEINTTETRVTNKLSVYLSEIVELKIQEKNDEEAAIATKNALNREDIREMIRRIVREEIREAGR